MRTCIRVVVACLLGLIFCLIGQGSGFAHTELSESSPGDGDVLASAPAQVVLRFTEPVVPDLSEVVLQDPDEVIHRSERLALATDGALVASMTPSGPDGLWRMSYRVVSVDGHPVVGTIEFSVGAAAVQQSGASLGSPVRWVVAGVAVLLVAGVALALRASAGKDPDAADPAENQL